MPGPQGRWRQELIGDEGFNDYVRLRKEDKLLRRGTAARDVAEFSVHVCVTQNTAV